MPDETTTPKARTPRTPRAKASETRTLSEQQLGLLVYLADVELATKRGLYRAGVSDATGRTLGSLVKAGLVFNDSFVGGGGVAELYRLTPEGLQAIERFRTLVSAL